MKVEAVSTLIATMVSTTLCLAKDNRLPNLVVIMADDLGYGDLGCYGSTLHHTPHIDRMAAGGMRFTDFYVTSPICSPTRAAFLTGRSPLRCGSPGVLWPTSGPDEGSLPQEEITFPELLQPVGYATHLSGKWHLGHALPEQLPTGHGFDNWYGMPYPNDMKSGHPQEAARGGKWPEMPMMLNSEIVEQPIDVNLLTQQYTADAVNFIAKNHHRPFFLFLAHAMPHSIIGASPGFLEKSQNGLYGAAIEELDWSTGEIMRALHAYGLDENTLVIFTSDNGAVTPRTDKNYKDRFFRPDGTHGSNAPLRGGKQVTFEGGVRVPGIFYWPGVVQAGKTETTPAIITDVFPTFLDYLGIPLPKDRVIDGRTLRLLLEGTGSRDPSDFFFGGHRAVTGMRSGKWKLQLPEQPGWMLPPLESNKPMLFDLSTDIEEKHNVADQYPAAVSELLGRLDAYTKEVESKP